MRKNVFWWVLVLALVFAGFLVSLPWPNVQDNFLGYASLCSFVPFASIVLFNSAIAVYSWFSKHRQVLYGTIAIFLMVVGFMGWWFFEFKMPMNSLTTSMTMDSFWIGNTKILSEMPENVSSITFHLNIENSTDRATPLFIIQPVSVSIDGIELVDGFSLDCLNGTAQSYGLKWFNDPTILKPNSQMSLRMRLMIFFDYLATRGGTPQDVWDRMHGAFTFTMNGILTARPFFNEPSTTDTERSTFAAKQFTLSQRYG